MDAKANYFLDGLKIIIFKIETMLLTSNRKIQRRCYLQNIKKKKREKNL